MASTTFNKKVFENERKNSSNHSSNHSREISREEIQSAIAKAVELRAVHAALKQTNSPVRLGFPSSSPASRSASIAGDYPVFTPSNEDDSLVGYPHVPVKFRKEMESWDGNGFKNGRGIRLETVETDYKKGNSSSRNDLPSSFRSTQPHICPVEDYKSTSGSASNAITWLQTSPSNNYFLKSRRRNSNGDSQSVSSCNRWKPAILTTESEINRSNKNSNIVVPFSDSHSPVPSKPKGKKGMSWLFPRLKKKHAKTENSPNKTESEGVSQILKDFGVMSVESLKKELIEAKESRDLALMEVSKMRSSFGEFNKKLEYLESYCEELKKALRQAVPANDFHMPQKLGNLHRRGMPLDEDGENPMPVSEEVLVEGFLQMVSEARQSVKQFCRTLIDHIDETDNALISNINTLLQPCKLSLNAKYSKPVLYHFEALISQSLYQDFENCVFQKNGSSKHLDPQQDRGAQFSSFVSLRNLSWNEVLRKGTKHYSEELSKFCDLNMSCIISTLNWKRPWSEKLLQTFFVAAKCVWLLHLLAFSFNSPLRIFRVEENRSFDAHYMEDMSMERQRCQGPCWVRLMVMPGFYVQDRVVKCKVLCKYNSAV